MPAVTRWPSRTSSPRRARTPENLDISATVTFEIVDGAPTVSRSALKVRGTVSGIDADGFAKLATAAKDGCPVSRALAGVEITLDAALA